MTNPHKGNVNARHAIEQCVVKVADSADSTATLVYVGDLAKIKAKAGSFRVGHNAPAGEIPSSLKITDETFEVASVEIAGGPGGTGRLTVGLSAKSADATGGSSILNVDWSLEWTLVERKLELHPTFAPLFDPSDNNYALAPINKWEKIQDEYPEKYAAFEYPKTLDKEGNVSAWEKLKDVSDLALKYCQKLAKGISAYNVQVPVVRKTKYQTSGPLATADAGSTCGQREEPDRFKTVAKAWLKTADSWQKTGLSRWEHRQEWTGFDSLDEDLYPQKGH